MIGAAIIAAAIISQTDTSTAAAWRAAALGWELAAVRVRGQLDECRSALAASERQTAELARQAPPPAPATIPRWVPAVTVGAIVGATAGASGGAVAAEEAPAAGAGLGGGAGAVVGGVLGALAWWLVM